MIENIVLGFIQGIAEWLPVSSEGMVSIVNIAFLGGGLKDSISFAIFLHLGTFLAALFYFRQDVLEILKYGRRASVRFSIRTQGVRGSENDDDEEYGKILIFLVISTIFTGIVGWFLLFKIFLQGAPVLGIKTTLGLIGGFLIITGLLQFRKSEEGFSAGGGSTFGGKDAKDISLFDGILLGIVQGFAALPGLSRSGLTIATFLFRGYKDTEALRLSFLMSLPAVLGANVLLALQTFSLEVSPFRQSIFDINLTSVLVGLFVSFVVGLLTIHGLISLSRKINFGWFAVLFGILTLTGILVL